MAIYVGGTGNSNLLDDYEEGSWTPTLLNASNNPGVAGASGRYVKVGGMVFLAGYWQSWSGNNDGLSTFSSPSSYFRMGGIPFAPNNAVGHVTCLGPVTSQALKWQGAPWNNYGSSATIHACPQSGQNYVEFYVNPAGPTETYRGTLTNNAFHNLSPIMTFSVTYRVF
tara:strand:- start:435 stop:938 length:504 start_codon:yes stop_codon:yes gene_type:complete